jgi:hypothetical protein
VRKHNYCDVFLAFAGATLKKSARTSKSENCSVKAVDLFKKLRLLSGRVY